jgi:hypothetical protein
MATTTLALRGVDIQRKSAQTKTPQAAGLEGLRQRLEPPHKMLLLQSTSIMKWPRKKQKNEVQHLQAKREMTFSLSLSLSLSYISCHSLLALPFVLILLSCQQTAAATPSISTSNGEAWPPLEGKTVRNIASGLRKAIILILSITACEIFSIRFWFLASLSARIWRAYIRNLLFVFHFHCVSKSPGTSPHILRDLPEVRSVICSSRRRAGPKGGPE